MDTTKFKTETEKAYQEKLRSIILQHCVACHQQLDLLHNNDVRCKLGQWTTGNIYIYMGWLGNHLVHIRW